MISNIMVCPLQESCCICLARNFPFTGNPICSLARNPHFFFLYSELSPVLHWDLFFTHCNSFWVKFCFYHFNCFADLIFLGRSPESSYKSENCVKWWFQNIWTETQNTVGFGGGIIISIWDVLRFRCLIILILVPFRCYTHRPEFKYVILIHFNI